MNNGINQSKIDYRDFRLKEVLNTLPAKTNNPRPPSVYQQGQLNACIAYSIKNLKEMQEFKERGVWTPYSAGFMYALMGEGSDIRVSLKKLRTYGICEHRDYPWIDEYPRNQAKFNEIKDRVMPLALPQCICEYGRLYNEKEIKSAIHHFGGVLVNANLDRSFYSNKGQRINVPDKYSPLNYYHCMIAVNYEEINGKTYYEILNSWGSDWGNNGTVWVESTHPMFMEFWYAYDNKLEPQNVFSIEIPIGSKIITRYTNFDEKVEKFEAVEAAFIKNGTTFLPARPIAEALGLNVKWDDKNRISTLSNR